MEDNRYSNDTYKEALLVLCYCENNVLDMIPDNILKFMNDKAAESDKTFCIDEYKDLQHQEVTYACKELLSELYYRYMNI